MSGLEPTPSDAIGGASSPEPDAAASAVDLRVTAGSPSPQELAAVRAVLEGALRELRVHHEERSATGPDAWQRSARGLRGPIIPGPGRWNHPDH